MAKYTIEDTTLTNIASAIREKTGKSELLLPSQMPSEIQSISGGGEDFEINDASYLFYYQARLECIDLFLSKFKNVNNMRYCFADDTPFIEQEILDLSTIDFSKCSNFSYMFYTSSSMLDQQLKKIILPSDFSLATNFSNMFYGVALEELDLSNIETVKNVDTSYMFAYSEISNIIFPKLTISNASAMFNYFRNKSSSSSVTINISPIDFSECTNMFNMFNYCKAETITHTNFDCSKVTNVSNAFRTNSYIINMCPLINLGKGYTQKSANYNSYKLDLSSCVNLTHDSLLGIINGLYDLNLTYDVAGGGTLYTQQLVLGSTNLAKLTEDEIAIGTNKGWVIS